MKAKVFQKKKVLFPIKARRPSGLLALYHAILLLISKDLCPVWRSLAAYVIANTNVSIVFVQKLAAGGLLGGILAGVFSRKLKIQDCHIMLLLSAFGLLPISIALYLNLPVMASYLIITICCFLVMMFATLFSVQALTFVQMETPSHLIGKVISWVLALSMCAQPVGQAIYGGLFEELSSVSWVLILGGALSSAVVAFLSKRVFKEM